MDIFATAVLNKVVESLDRPASFLLDAYFPYVQTEESEQIHFDIDDTKPRIAPFVSPLVAGKVLAEDGFHTKSFTPAYVKDKRRFNPNKPLKRIMGESIGGSLSGEQRIRAALATSMVDQLNRLTRRMEVMGAEALRTGKITVTGEQYPTTVVDFERDAALSVTLGAGSMWGDSGVKPLDNLETWAGNVQSKSGAVATRVTMDPKAWQLFRVDADVEKLLDTRRGSNATAEVGPMARGQGNAKGRHVATVGDFDIWVYQDSYVDDAGATQQMLPDYSVILGDPMNIEGTRCFGMIQDEKAGFKALEYFSKSWLEEDPAVRYLLMQCAPLIVPYRVNATAYTKVKT